MATLKCKHCRLSFPLEEERCPHCARPGLFANVEAAKLQEERRALKKRYQAATAAAVVRDCADQVRQLEERLAVSHAVMNRSALEVARLASSDRELHSTFYKLLDAEVQLPFGDAWDHLRRVADVALFPGYMEKIRFASLSLDGLGLFHYGDCTLVLREAMIAHRASVFHENSALFLRRYNYEPPPGYRAIWKDRAKLCVAKLAGRVHELIPESEFPTLLLWQGISPEQDQFVEVHIWGPLSIHCWERVIAKRFAALSPSLLLALQELLDKTGVGLEILP